MLPPFKLGLGGRFGDGTQFMPWIHREDLVRAILFLLERDDLAGPFNGSAPTRSPTPSSPAPWPGSWGARR